MNFFEIIKRMVVNIVDSLPLSEPYVGEVIEKSPLRVRINEKLILCDDEIVRTSAFLGDIEEKTLLLFIKSAGGQKFFLINTIPRELKGEKYDTRDDV